MDYGCSVPFNSSYPFVSIKSNCSTGKFLYLYACLKVYFIADFIILNRLLYCIVTVIRIQKCAQSHVQLQQTAHLIAIKNAILMIVIMNEG
jgi:hypothetical protein